MSELKQRKAALPAAPTQDQNADSRPLQAHPIGEIQHSPGMQALRIVGFGIYFLGSCLFIYGAELLGLPLYVINREWHYAWVALTKQFFGLLITTMTQWWSPTVIRVSGDKSVAGLLKQDESGMLSMDFDHRAVVMANHQIYTDWLYMWWVAYANDPPMHGHIYIILKDSLKWVPMIGPAMQIFGFVFMSRKWAADQIALRDRLQKLNTRHSSPLSGQRGKPQLNPMWLLIFPEGTNLSRNTRKGSAKFAEKSGIQDMKHQVLPRSTGLLFCLRELRETVDYLYDCTIGYEGTPPGYYSAELFTLRSVYFQGRPPKSVNMHWRRFKVKDLPLDDADQFNEWVLDRWREKDDLLDAFVKTGKFPADKSAVSIEGGPTDSFKTAYINTEVRTRNPVEFLSMFAPVAAVTMLANAVVRFLDRFDAMLK